MPGLVSQATPSGQPAPGFAQRDVSVAVIDKGLQAASFTAQAVSDSVNFYTAPSGGTIVLPVPTGSRRQIMFALYGAEFTTFSGTISSNGVIYSSLAMVGDQTLTITDADATRGWV